MELGLIQQAARCSTVTGQGGELTWSRSLGSLVLFWQQLCRLRCLHLLRQGHWRFPLRRLGRSRNARFGYSSRSLFLLLPHARDRLRYDVGHGLGGGRAVRGSIRESSLRGIRDNSMSACLRNTNTSLCAILSPSLIALGGLV